MEWWKEFFGSTYLNVDLGVITQERTMREVEFIQQQMRLSAGSQILDLCCGIGRHSFELARAGFQVVGLDYSLSYIEIARQRARCETAPPRFVVADMRSIPFRDTFDTVINLYTSIGYFENEAENLRVLQEVSRVLADGGRFIIEAESRDWYMRNPHSQGSYAVDQGVVLEETAFDLATSRLTWTLTFLDCSKKAITATWRIYSAEELERMLAMSGFEVERVCGNYEGDKLTAESLTMILIAQKQPTANSNT